MFQTNIVEFLTGRVNGKFRPGSDGSSVLTLPELIGIGPGGIGGNYGPGRGPLSAEVSMNLKNGGGKMLAGIILIPIAANVLTKVLRKPVLLPANRMLKAVGLDVKV